MLSHLVFIIFHWFRHLGVYGVFLSMFIENIGIPLPTEIGYLIAQDLIVRHIFSYPIILTILTLGHVGGSLVSYRIGRWSDGLVATKLKENKKIQEVHEKLAKWYKKYGNLTVFLTRFVGYVRPWSSFVAGFAEVPFWPFLIWTTVGSLIFNVITLYFSGIIVLIWRRYAVFHVAIISVAAFLFFGFLIYELVKYLFAFKNKK